MALVNGALDPVWAGSAGGIVFSNGFISTRQLNACQTFGRLHAITYGKPYADCVSPLDEFLPWQSGETPTEDMHAAAERKVAKFRRLLTAAQFDQVENVAVWGYVPRWLFAVRLRRRLLPQDVVDQQNLIDGLNGLADALGLEKRSEMNNTQHIDALRHQRARAKRNIEAAWAQISDQYDRDKYIEIQKTALAGLDIELDRLGYRPPPVINLNALPPRQPSRPPVVRHLGALLTIRSLDAEQRIVQGLATTGAIDLLGDRVNPRGARYSLPLPLLLHHDHQSPVGEVVAARSTDDGIEITAQIARLTNNGDVKRMCDRAWDLVRSKLLKGLSIGFKAIEREVLPDGGYYWKSWQWLELSLVTIAAQPQAKIVTTRAA